MPLALHHVVIDTHDLPRLARFWAEALRWQILSEREREVAEAGPAQLTQAASAAWTLASMSVTG